MIYSQDEASLRQACQERAENYVESIFMHTGEAIETFINYFELDFEHGVMSPKANIKQGEIEALSNGKLFSALLNTTNPDIRRICASQLRVRIRQLAQQHGVIDKMVEKVANDIYNSDFK